MLEFYKKYKSKIKIVGIVILSLIVLYYLINILTPKPSIPTEYKNQIDSLTKINVNIQHQQKLLIDSISNYHSDINKLDDKIKDIKFNKTVVQNYYSQQQSKVDKYYYTQIDSFFQDRYKY